MTEVRWRGDTVALPATLEELVAPIWGDLRQGRTRRALARVLGSRYRRHRNATVAELDELGDLIAAAYELPSWSSIVGLLAALDTHQAAIEADLQRFYGIDMRAEALPLRRLHVLIHYLPPESAFAVEIRGGKDVWRLEHVLLADIWQATARSKTPHPALTEARNDVEARDPVRQRRIAKARQRARQRKAAQAAARKAMQA